MPLAYFGYVSYELNFVLSLIIFGSLSLFISYKFFRVDLRNILDDKRGLIGIYAIFSLFYVPMLIVYSFSDEFYDWRDLVVYYIFPIFFSIALFASWYLHFQKKNEPVRFIIYLSAIFFLVECIYYRIWGWDDFRTGNVHSFYFLFVTIIELTILGILIRGVYLMTKSEKGLENKSTYQPNNEISEKEFLPTFLLCFFFGGLGIHRFYVGKIGTGVLMIFTLGGLGLWIIIDLIMILIGSFRDINGRIVKYNSGSKSSSGENKIGVAAEIEQLANLRDKGIITEEEFSKKKEELLQ